MRKSKWFAGVVLSVTLMLISGGLAMADTLIVNDLVTGGNTTLEPGDTGSAKVWLEVTNGTPSVDVNGCNATGTLPATVTLSASPNIVTFTSTASLTGCGVANAASVAYTVSNSATSGQIATISGTVSGGKIGAGYNTNDNFTVTVDVANTAPSVSVTGFADGASYEKGVDTLPTPACLASDLEDSPIIQPSPNVNTSGLNAFGLGTVTVTCDYTDGGGLAATQDSKSYSIVDTMDPTNITFTGGGITDGASYYFGSVPAGPDGCTADDVGSGLDECQVTGGGTSIGDHTYTATATDNAGNSDTATLSYTVLNNPPTVEVTGFTDGTIYEKGVDTLPTPGCDASDVEDGASNPTPTSDDSGLNAHGLGVVEVTCSVTDSGGLQDSDSKSYSIDDTLDPTDIAFTGGFITEGGSYYFGSVPSGPTGCTATDVGSGLASCAVTGGGTSVGSKTFTATATDNAGNDATASLNYTVLAWTLNGFYSPVDLNNVVNVAKAGSTVPLKFEIFAGTTELTDTSAVDTFRVAKSSACNGSYGTEDAIEQYSTGGTSLRYDTTGGQFVQNWKLPAGAGICYRVTMLADDGSSASALFRSK